MEEKNMESQDDKSINNSQIEFKMKDWFLKMKWCQDCQCYKYAWYFNYINFGSQGNKFSKCGKCEIVYTFCSKCKDYHILEEEFIIETLYNYKCANCKNYIEKEIILDS